MEETTLDTRLDVIRHENFMSVCLGPQSRSRSLSFPGSCTFDSLQTKHETLVTSFDHWTTRIDWAFIET